MRKHWKVILIAAAFLALGVWAAFGQESVFVSSEQKVVTNGDVVYTDGEYVITIDRGHIRWLFGSGDGEYVNLLITSAPEWDEEDGINMLFFSTIDRGCNESMFSIIMLEDGSDMICIGNKNKLIYFKGEFLEDKPESKSNTSWERSKRQS